MILTFLLLFFDLLEFRENVVIEFKLIFLIFFDDFDFTELYDIFFFFDKFSNNKFLSNFVVFKFFLLCFLNPKPIIFVLFKIGLFDISIFVK